MSEIHVLVLATLDPGQRKQIEEVADSVAYGSRAPGDPNSPFRVSVERSHLAKITCIIGWQAPEGVDNPSDLPNLQWWMIPAAGADRLLNKPIWQNGDLRKRVILTSNSGTHMAVIPSYIVGMVINLFQRTKDDIQRQQQQRAEDKWVRRTDYYIKEVYGSTWGILGYGRIGRETARLAKVFNCRILAATSSGKRAPDEEARLLGLDLGDPEGSLPDEFFSTADDVAFEQFLGQLDVLVISIPGTAKTNKIMNERTLNMLKKGAALVNVGRGEVIDTEALIKVIRSGHLSGAALDVQDPEPFPSYSPLWDLDNVIITPHIAGSTEQYLARSIDIWVANARRFKRGQNLLNIIDLDKGY